MNVYTLTKKNEIMGVMVGYMSLSFEKKDGKATELVLNAHPPKGDSAFKRRVTLSRDEVVNLISYAKHVGLADVDGTA